MKLTSIQYSEYKGQAGEWELERCGFDDINLIVGRNATGKTRTLNVILWLAKLLSGESKPRLDSGNFDAVFGKNGSEIKYVLHCENKNVIKEELLKESKLLLQRGSDGTGKIFADKLNDYIEFQPPSDELAVVSRRDAIQHPFFDDLYRWGKETVSFRFGTQMGQNRLSISDREDEINFNDSNRNVVAVFSKGIIEYGKEYVQSIIDDMRKIGYHLEDASLQIVRVKEMGEIGHEEILPIVKGIQVKEKNLDTITSHFSISSGMFRAMSLIIQLNYLLLSGMSGCIVIDDIGEGLDYSRSTALINLLINKVKDTDMQMIMSTNDRFVMNSVPLRYWSLIHHIHRKSVIHNYFNSKERFEEFEFTGLSNFDFFSSDYILRNEI